MNTYQKTADTENFQGFGPKHRGCGGPFSRMFANKFAEQFGGRATWGKSFGGSFGNRKAANIEENETEFIISLYAAGLIKSNFKVSASNDVLTIAYEVPQTGGKAQSQYTHQEYEPGSFERSFQLNGKVLTESMSAEYTDGVLKVTLPKNPETNKPAQEINVN